MKLSFLALFERIENFKFYKMENLEKRSSSDLQSESWSITTVYDAVYEKDNTENEAVNVVAGGRGHQTSNIRVRMFDNVRYFLNFEMFDVRMFANIQMFDCSKVRMFAHIRMFACSMFECSLFFF